MLQDETDYIDDISKNLAGHNILKLYEIIWFMSDPPSLDNS